MLTLDPIELKRRFSLRLSLFELAALITAVCFAVWTVIQHARDPISGLLNDYTVFTNVSRGDLHGYYYSLWAFPLFVPFAMLPFDVGAVLWQLINIAGMFFSARVFGGKSAALLLSYQMFVDLYFGQVSGVLCLGIALMWIGLANKKWWLAGLGLSIAIIKPQVGVIAGFFWLYALQDSYRNKTGKLITCCLSTIVPASAILLSFLIQPHWLTDILVRLRTAPPNNVANITAWDYLGAWGLLALIPPVLLPLTPRNRLLAFISAWLISAPYFQPYDMAILFMTLPNWLPLLSWIAVPFGYPQPALPLIFLILLTLFYLWQITPGVIQLFTRSKSLQDDRINV